MIPAVVQPQYRVVQYRVVSYSVFVRDGDRLRVDNNTFAVCLRSDDNQFVPVPVRAHYAHAVQEIQLLSVM